MISRGAAARPAAPRFSAFVAPSAETGAVAVWTAILPEDTTIDIPDPAPDPAGANAYPIVTFTWALPRNAPEDQLRAEATRAFTRWTVGEGQALATALGYVTLPPSVQGRAAHAVPASF